MAKDTTPPTEESGFDWSVLWTEEPPGAFTMPHIIEVVLLVIILIRVMLLK